MSLRARWRRATLGLATLAGRRRGWFIPYRYAETAGVPGPYEALERLFAARHAEFREALAGLERLAPALEAIGAPAPPAGEGEPRPPRWDQGWFPRLDAAVAYALVRWLAPQRIVEIGAGHSTRFLARAVADGRLTTRITTIDPAPRAALYGIDFEFLRQPVQRVPHVVFDALGAGDMLVVDSSHILMPGTDVDAVLNRLWPELAEGVLVHFHDIFLPDDYPPAWAWRGYNEQNAVGALLGSGGAEILWSSHYVATRLADALDGTVVARLPLFPGAVETSLWVRKAH